MTAPVQPTHARRSDARRNHERIVAAAREVFAEGGVDATVEEITHRAGVGMGTLYRHFPTKAELVDAVLEDAFAQLVASAEAAVADADPWTAFARFLEHALELNAANRGLKDLVENPEQGRRRAEAMRTRLRPLIRELVERAHAQGALRSDFDVRDVGPLLWAGAGVIERSPADDPDAWRRHLRFVVDGLRASAAAAPGTPSA